MLRQCAVTSVVLRRGDGDSWMDRARNGGISEFLPRIDGGDSWLERAKLRAGIGDSWREFESVGTFSKSLATSACGRAAFGARLSPKVPAIGSSHQAEAPRPVASVLR